MLRKAKLKLLVVTFCLTLCLALIPRATASYGEVNSFRRNPHSNVGIANENAAFYVDYYERIISVWTCDPMCYPWGDAIFDGDIALGMGHSYFWFREDFENFAEHKKWVMNDFRVVLSIDEVEVDTKMTPLVYSPHFDLDGDGIPEPAYVCRVGAAFKPGELSEGEHVFNWQEFVYNHATETWDLVFDLSWYITSVFWIEYN
jgi:hypothetical protein